MPNSRVHRPAPARPPPQQSLFYIDETPTPTYVHGPTVIKTTEGNSRLKKRPPPRPPPPKVGTSTKPSKPGSRSFAPPSYDDVIRSDNHSFVNPSFPSWDDAPSVAANKRNVTSSRPNKNQAPRVILPAPTKKPLIRTSGHSSSAVRKPSDDLLELADVFNNLQGVGEGGSDMHQGNWGSRDPWGSSAPSKPSLAGKPGVSGHPWPPPSNNNEIEWDKPPQTIPDNSSAQLRSKSTSAVPVTPKPTVLAKPTSLGKTALPPRPVSTSTSYGNSNSTADGFANLSKALCSLTPSGPYCVAEFDYNASQSDELTFNAGDTISLTSRVNAEWLIGKLGHREGIFPESFVKIEVPLPSEETVAPTCAGSQCRALYDFKASSDGDLPFKAGDMIAIDEQIDSAWVRGTAANGRSGVFPLSFVEVFSNYTNITDDWKEECTQRLSGSYEVEQSPTVSKNNFKYDDIIGEYLVLYDFEAQSPEELNLKQGQRAFVTGSSSSDWLSGYVVGGKDLKDKIFPKSFVTKIEDDGSGSAKVLYDFEPTSPDEMKCMAGESVSVVKEVSKDWLLVEKNGASGMVPTSFVQIL